MAVFTKAIVRDRSESHVLVAPSANILPCKYHTLEERVLLFWAVVIYHCDLQISGPTMQPVPKSLAFTPGGFTW